MIVAARTGARARLRPLLRILGPGLVAGASDNDPTTVATVAVVGATTVYALGWVVLLIFPMLAVVQAIAARVGIVTRRDLGTLVASRYGRWPWWILVASVVSVSVFTVAADLKAGAAALGLLAGIDLRWFIVPLAVVTLLLLSLRSAKRVRQILQAVAMVFLAYVISAFAAHPNWGTLLHHSLLPSWHWNQNYATGAVALLGTTLTSYVYVWETIELADERPEESVGEAQLDGVMGSLFAVAVMWFILVATGATLGVHHEQVQTAQDAARALKPFAGPAASAAFGVGLLASALLALPVLTSTSVRLLTRRNPGSSGLLSPSGALMTAILAIAVVVSFTHVSAIHILYAASIAGAVGTPVSLVFLLLVARDRPTMGQGRVSRGLTVAGYVIAALVTSFGFAALVTS